MKEELLQIPDPENYYEGVGSRPLPTPSQILFFLRRNKESLQQKALQNRSHHRTLLCFNLKTEGTVHLDHFELTLRQGQALVILPYQFHHYSHLRSTKLKWLFCSFELDSYGILEPLRNRVIDPREKSLNTLSQLLHEWHSPASGLQAGLVQCTLVRLLFGLRQDLKHGKGKAPSESGSSLLRTVNRLLEEWRGRTVTVSDLAGAVGYSESHIRLLFKQDVGVPLGTYIQNYRINRAISLLRTTSLSIADVAENAGFGSPQACSRMFKQATGQTPREFRAGHPPEMR